MADVRRAAPWGPLCLVVVIACLPLGVHSRYYQSIAVIIGLHSIAAVGHPFSWGTPVRFR